MPHPNNQKKKKSRLTKALQEGLAGGASIAGGRVLGRGIKKILKKKKK